MKVLNKTDHTTLVILCFVHSQLNILVHAQLNFIIQIINFLFKEISTLNFYCCFTDSLPVSDTGCPLNNFYADRITLKHTKTLFEHIFADLDLQDYHKFLSYLVKVSFRKKLKVNLYKVLCILFLQILPNSVLEEWMSICIALESRSSFEKAIETLTDMLILLCHVTKSQNEDAPAYSGLDFCLECYGNVIKVRYLCISKEFLFLIFLLQELMSSKSNNSDNEIIITKCICRLLREMPKKSIEVNRCNLISLASDTSLQNLSTDKQFVCGLMAIGDSITAQMLAKKMLK